MHDAFLMRRAWHTLSLEKTVDLCRQGFKTNSTGWIDDRQVARIFRLKRSEHLDRKADAVIDFPLNILTLIIEVSQNQFSSTTQPMNKSNSAKKTTRRATAKPSREPSRKIHKTSRPRADDLKSTTAFERRLRAAFATIDVAHTLTSPLLRSIESLLQLSAQIIGSNEASVIVRDGTRGGLRFLAATGDFADDIKKMRIPPGKGVAGFVFTSGQPVAIADVSRDESFYDAVDQATGHSTQMMLATPLRVGEETIGVLEFINRSAGPPYVPFSPADMDRAAYFAETIALLVDAHEQAHLIESLLAQALQKAVADDVEKQNWQQWLSRVRAAPEHKELLSLAIALCDVAAQGEDERKLCQDVLGALSRWTHKRHATNQNFFS